jgi:Domain of unknown function (DUF5060)
VGEKRQQPLLFTFKPSFWRAALLVVAVGFTFVVCRQGGQTKATAYYVKSQASSEVPRYDIFELSVDHNGVYSNNFFDVDLDAKFRSPTGIEHRIKGFFYGGHLWKVRFRPDEVGTWTYFYSFTGTGGFRRQASGMFRCLPSGEAGPVRRNPENAFRWVFASGKAFFPVGLQDCIYLDGDRNRNIGIDGESRNQSGRRVSWDEYFSIYGKAGFNLFRFSQKNCSYLLMDGLDDYRVAESIATDDLLSAAHEHGFRVMFGFFGYHGRQQSETRAINILERTMNDALGKRTEAIQNPEDRDLVGKEERFVAYCVARWGVYADFWELLNERKASDSWTTLMADYVRSVDPDHKPISTSWEKAELPSIDINAPHWYESENELSSDLRVQQMATKWKQAGKPVIVGEQGNGGMNWDPRSAIRMRIRVWTALFQEISLVFWNTSWSKAGMFGGRYTPGGAANIYLGPEERGYIRVLQDFSSRLDSGIRKVSVATTSSSQVRAYGLVSAKSAAVYLHHTTTHETRVEDATVRCDFLPIFRQVWEGEWIDPGTGNVISRVTTSRGSSALQVPPFKVDIALFVHQR